MSRRRILVTIPFGFERASGVERLAREFQEAAPDRGTVTLEFEVGTDIGEALVRVTNRLTQVPRYPENADQPVVTTANSAGPPLAVILLQASDGGDVGAYRTWVEENVLPRIERIDGEPARSSPRAAAFEKHGFRADYKGLVLERFEAGRARSHDAR